MIRIAVGWSLAGAPVRSLRDGKFEAQLTYRARRPDAVGQAWARNQVSTARTRRFSSPGSRSSLRKTFATCLATAPSDLTRDTLVGFR